MNLTEQANAMALTATTAARHLIETERHLLAEQSDLIGASSGDGVAVSTSTISDPTGRAATSPLAGFVYRRDRVAIAAGKVMRALNELSAECSRAVTNELPPNPDDKARCPGWSLELRTRLGGCGKVVERRQLASGWVDREYCVTCRRHAEAAKRRQEHEHADGAA